MGRTVDDCAKRRLVEHDEIEFAIRFMTSRGVKHDDVPVQLARYYYVDIDEVNAIMAKVEADPALAEKTRPTAAAPASKLRNVA
jgi:ribosomal protein S24E